MNVYIPSSGFATQGPAPEGFHVPLQTEWEGLKTIMDGLGLATGDNWRINLHMPFAGIRSWSSAKIGSQGSNGRYWMSSPNKSSINHNDAIYLWISSSSVGANYSDPRTQGQSVRCFKNSFELPTSSWTVINGTLGGAGIFWDTTNGLISITSDGTTGYTIQDKNLGATTVYNDGDTLTEANCGKYYQWGNNYGFPFTGSITTSTTQVDTTGYGPGNYYSSSTFITRSGDFRDWSSVRNDNLRGGVDGNVQVVNELKNAYIGEVYEYSYDFRNKTISQVQADGWNIFDGLSAATINSYGISLTNGQELRAKIDKSGILNNAKKITMEMIVTLNGFSASRFSYYKTATTSTREGITGPRYANSGYGTTIYDNSTTDSVSLSGTATMTTVLDLDNKTWITTSSKGYSRSGTLTDAQVSGIRNDTNGIYINVSANGGIGYIYTLVE